MGAGMDGKPGQYVARNGCRMERPRQMHETAADLTKPSKVSPHLGRPRIGPSFFRAQRPLTPTCCCVQTCTPLPCPGQRLLRLPRRASDSQSRCWMPKCTPCCTPCPGQRLLRLPRRASDSPSRERLDRGSTPIRARLGPTWLPPRIASHQGTASCLAMLRWLPRLWRQQRQSSTEHASSSGWPASRSSTCPPAAPPPL